MFRHLRNYLCGYSQDSDRSNNHLKPHLPYGPLLAFCFTVLMAVFSANLMVLLDYDVDLSSFSIGTLFLLLFTVGGALLIACAVAIYHDLDAMHNSKYLFCCAHDVYPSLFEDELNESAFETDKRRLGK